MKQPRVALVTGSGKKRIGWHVADALAKHGWNVIVHYHTSAQEAEEAVAVFRRYGVECVALQAD
ncbi:MAG TPA: oxidoreductase, partial [Gemmataceae bacterium]